MQSNLK
jgi:ankyrin repeat protein